MSKLCYVLDVILISSIGILLCQYSLSGDHAFSTSKDRYLPSKYLVYNGVVDSEEEVKEINIASNEDKVLEVPPETNPSINTVDQDSVDVFVEEDIKKTDKSSDIIETLIGNMSGYGPDCIGCSSHTASGYNVGNGNIYYNDSTYGKVRILAGDNKYPFYTIVRINNSNVSKEPLLGIVLDRGGMIGLGGKYLFDLLCTSEKEANSLGVSKNVTFEILRMGLG